MKKKDHLNSMEVIMEIGLSEMQQHYQKEIVTIADAVNYFHTRPTKKSALPSLTIACALLTKYGAGFDKITRPGLANSWQALLIEKWQSLP